MGAERERPEIMTTEDFINDVDPATEAKQDVGNTTLSTISAKLITGIPLVPTTSGGLTIYRNIDLDETGQNIKGSTGQLYGYYFYNAAATVRYLKFYNKATAPTVGSDTPVLTLPLPPGAAGHVEFTDGIAFSTGIGAGATTGVADNDTGAPSANDVVVNILYK